MENVKFLPHRVQTGVLSWLQLFYPATIDVAFPGRCFISVPGVRMIAPEEITHPRLKTLSFRIEASIFVARQLIRHQQKLAWNEVSRRYVDEPGTFHQVGAWRRRAENKKQGSSDELITHFDDHVNDEDESIDRAYLESYLAADRLYGQLIKTGVAPEQARMVLPLATNTEWIWTGSVERFHAICSERLAPNAQLETREVAAEIAKHL
jgi:thymidylate synthase (FAD)